MPPKIPNLPMKPFTTPDAFRKWLATNHTKSAGLWIQFFKKASGQKSISYAQALDIALCFGWIDGQIKRHDEHSWIHKFTPRRPKSGWSKRNTEHAERLIAANLMHPAGLAAVIAAKSDGRWQAAYDSPKNSDPPADLLAALAKNKKARTFFDSLNKANRYAITYRLQTAKKPETRARRLKVILEMLNTGKKFH
jgi:uncharacterized protein YdeI (YjbR/CyaY-like superfamily)